jgi:hypothetical protein
MVMEKMPSTTFNREKTVIRTHRLLTIGLMIMLFSTLSITGQSWGSSDAEYPPPELGFPFENPNKVAGIISYGVGPWEDDTPHNAIDIIPYFQSEDHAFSKNKRSKKRVRTVKIVSPVDGTVKMIVSEENRFSSDPPEMRQWILVLIEYNPAWVVGLAFEPKAPEERLHKKQVNLIKVKAGQVVKKGDKIGRLVVGSGGGRYPHLAYGLLQKDPDEDIMSIFPFSQFFHSDTTRLPTFMCPYEYSTPEAIAIFDSITDRVPNEYCTCACKYEGDDYCGDGCMSH